MLMIKTKIKTKLLLTAFIMLGAVVVPLEVVAQGWPAGYGGVMLQGFFWDSFRNADGYTDKTLATMYGAGWGENDEWLVPVTTWTELLNQKENIAPYIDLLWLPQSGATVAPDKTTFTTSSSATRAGHNGTTVTTSYGDEINNPDCMGFVPVFYLDHGRGASYTVNGVQWTPTSYFGSEAELMDLISAYKAAGTGAIEDVVANHKGGLSTWSGVDNAADFVDETGVTGPTTGREYNITWDWDSDGKCVDICSDDESGKGSGNSDCGGDAGKGQWARDLDHHSATTRGKVVQYLQYLKDELGYVGFRYDYARGFEPKHFAYYNTTIRPTYSVGEFWGSFDEITTWIKGVYDEGTFQSAAFDFPLQAVIQTAFNDESGQSYRQLESAGLIWDYRFKRYAVTFIDNHDTFKDLPTDDSNSNYLHRVNHQIVEANCFILSMPGTPCLFYPHFMHSDWHDTLVKFIKARRTAGITNESAIWPSVQTGDYGIAWRVTGEKGELYLQLGSEAVATGVPDGFSQVWCNDGGTCRLSITSSLAEAVDANEKQDLVYGYPVVSKSSGNYTSPVEVNVKPSSAGTVLVYTTDGSTPNAYSKQITDTTGLDFTFSETTTLKVGVLANGTVRTSSVVTRDYVIDGTDDDGKITVYVKYDDGDELPWVYAYDADGNALTDEFPGWQYSTDNKVVVGGVTWLHATIEASQMNIILSRGGSDTQTADINGVTSDVFYTFADGVAYDLTTTYTEALYNPLVSVDPASGDYSGDITATLTASNSGATIVYTTDGSEPTPTSSTIAYQGSVTFSGEGSHTLRAGVLYNGSVINQVARTYYISGASGETLTEEVPPTTGVSIYVHSTGSSAPYVYAWNPPTEGTVEVSASWPGDLADTLKQVNGKKWYYKHYDVDSLRFIVNDGNGTQTADQRTYHPGAYFVEFDASTGAIENVTDDYVTYKSVGMSGDTTIVYIEGTNFFVRYGNIGSSYISYYDGTYIYAWDSDGNAVTDAFPGNVLQEQVTLGNTSRYSFYWHTDKQVAGYLVTYCYPNSTKTKFKTSDIVAISPGDNRLRYFHRDSNPAPFVNYYKDMLDCWWEFKYPQYAVEASADPGEDKAINVYVSAEVAPYLYAWNGDTQYNGAWPGGQLTDKTHERNNITWYVFTQEADGMSIILNDGNGNQTANIEGLTPGDYYLVYNGLTGYTLLPDALPSCATYQGDDVFYFYFENSAPYGAPYAWVYNGTTVYTGSCWPGEALVEPVGVAPNGNIIYRWTYSGDVTTLPANVVFNDNGGNVVGDSQTPDYTFVNGGYYNCNGLVGKVNDNLLTLAELIRYGTVGEEYVVANDLTGVWTDTKGESIWVKDNDGEANKLSLNSKPLKVPAALRGEEYDQSNWAQLVLKEPVNTTSTIGTYNGKTVLGQTVLGKFTNRENPTIELRANPIVGTSRNYTANVYVPANFVEQEEYFLVDPKPQEYVSLKWAMCRAASDDNLEFVFVVPKSDPDDGINSENIAGAVTCRIVDGYWSGSDELTNNGILVGYEYHDVLAIVKAIGSTSTGAPRRANITPDDATHSPVSTTWELYLIQATRGNEIYTAVTDAFAERQVLSVRYYNLLGHGSATPHDGINIVVTTYSDGTTSAVKVLR